MMTGLLAKTLASQSSEIKIFHAFLSHNYPKFMRNYHSWLQSNGLESLEA